MKIVVALDSFKGSLSAVRACTVVAETLRDAVAELDVVVKPMADGGEGTAAAILAAAGGEWIERQVVGSLPEMHVKAGFVWLPATRTAVVEMAAASGLTLLSPGQRNPLKTTTYGTGQLIAQAIEHGAERILLAVGGSATVDGGVGAASALGWSFLTQDGREIEAGGGQLSQIARIVPPEREIFAAVDVLCDVDNPLCGPHGAAQVYGPQKGATPQMVETLEAALSHLARIVREQLGRDIRDLPGAGAAGGLAAGAVAFMNAHLISGIDEVMSQSGLEKEMDRADWVVTGEGRFDQQSLRGKVVSGVTRLARAAGARVGVIAGQVDLPPDVCLGAGIEAAVPCADAKMDVEYAMTHGEELLAQASRRFAQSYLTC